MSFPTRNQIVIGNPVQVGCFDSSGEYYGTTGDVQDILTNADQHPHGIKVRLTSGVVGRVKALLDKPPVNPLAPHALQTAVAKCVARLLQEASYPAKGRDDDKVNKRFIARLRLADLIGALQVADLPDDSVHDEAFHNFRKAPQQTKIWGGYLNGDNLD